MAETSQTVTWLHISDLHCCTPKSHWDAHLVITKLVDDLKRMQKDHNLRPDFIFFTGDAAWGEIGSAKGEKIMDQFEAARRFFDSVRKAFEPEIPAVDLFLVPGNHDVNRKGVSEVDIEFLDRQKSLDTVIERIRKGDGDWQRWMQRLDDYRNFLTSSGYSHLVQDKDRLIYAACRNVSGVRVGIVGFNTAWACCRDGEKAKLWWAGKWQVGHLRQKLEGTAFNIGLLHHPPNWFGELEDPISWRDLELLCKFVLHGHEHDMWVHENVDGHTRISAAACYDRSDRENGYNLVRLNLESGVGEVWLRRFYQDVGQWDKRVVPEKAPDGVWPLTHLQRLVPKPPTMHAPEERAAYPGGPAGSVLKEPTYGIEPLLKSIVSQLATLSKPTSSYPQRETFDILFANMGLSMSGPRPDIVMRPIEASSVTRPEKPLHEKSPLLQELRTPEQVRDHFLPMPRVTKRVDEWLRCERDLMFLGLPFCGKTSLLTYLAVEAARNQETTVLPILLVPREDLPAEVVEAAIVDLKKRLERIKTKADKRLILLLLDNVHNPVHFEIASHLMASPRPWRVWGAARSGEFARLEESGRKSPWAEANMIRDACSLVGKSEAEWVMEQVLKPCLHFNKKENLESQVLEAIEDVGQVPTRFLIQVWGLIKEDKADVDTGYREIIRNLPKDIDAVVQSLMPHSIAGMQALVITDYLRNPPWEVLESVLTAVDEHGPKLAGDTIAQLRRVSSLVPDFEQSFRATMYDPLGEVIRREGNLPKAFKAQIWDALLSYLRVRNDVEPVGPALAGYWGEMREHARDSAQPEARIACAERALLYAVEDARVEALYELGLAKLGRDEAGVAEAHRNMTEACALADQLGEETKNAAYAMVIWAFYHPAQDAETFEQRLSRLADAERICSKLGEDSDVALIAESIVKLLLVGPKKDAATALRHASGAVEARKRLKDPAKLSTARVVLARCLHSQTPPDWEGAAKAYQEALPCLTGDAVEAMRAMALYFLAQCLHSQTPPDWEAAYQSSRQAVELYLELVQKSDAVQVLAQLVWLCPRCAQPPWEETTEFCRTVLGILTADEDKQLRGSALYCLAQCLHSQTPPDWEGAAKAYQEALPCLTGDAVEATRAMALYFLAQCLRNQTPPDWEAAYQSSRQAVELYLELIQKSDAVQVLAQLVWLCPRCAQPPWEETTEFCRTVLGILTADEDKQLRGSALYCLAQCLHSQTPPDWEGAAKAYQEALPCLTGDAVEATRAMALYFLAQCLRNQTPPDWEAAYQSSRQAVELYLELIQKSDAVQVLAQLVWLCPRCAQPPWEETTEFCRTVLGILTADEDKQLRGSALYFLAQCLHSQTPPDWEAAYQSSRQAVELYLELVQKSDAVQVLAQLVWLCPRCAQPPWEETTEFCRTVLGILTADEDKQLRGSALYCLAQCLHSQTPPDWEGAAKAYQEALPCLTGDAVEATRAMALYFLAQCLHSQTPPDWEAAYQSSRQAVELYLELVQKSDAVQVLAQLVWLCPRCAQPPWEETTEFCRTVLGILTADEDKQLRASTLIALSIILQTSPTPDWSEVFSIAREAVDTLKRSKKTSELERALIVLASALEDQPTPDLASAITVRKEACQEFPNVNGILGLVMSLDRAGEFAGADAWAAKLESSQLGGENEASNSPLARRRQAYLGLRRNDLTMVAEIASELRGTSENARSMLLLSIVHFAHGEYSETRECVQMAQPAHDDMTWFRPIVAAYFARHGRKDIAEYNEILSACHV